MVVSMPHHTFDVASSQTLGTQNNSQPLHAFESLVMAGVFFMDLG